MVSGDLLDKDVLVVLTRLIVAYTNDYKMNVFPSAKVSKTY